MLCIKNQLEVTFKFPISIGDDTVGKSALTQVFHSDGTHYPKNYLMVCKSSYLNYDLYKLLIQ